MEYIRSGFIGKIVTYQCPNCGCINSFYEETIKMFIENNVTNIVCEDCGSPIKGILENY